MQDIQKKVYGAGKGNLEDKSRVGSIYHTRGVTYGIMIVEAIRVAQDKFGKGKVMTPEQVRWGLEHLDLSEARLKELGASGLFPPVKTSCLDHEGSGMVKFQQWDGKEFKPLTPFMAGDRALVRKMVEEGAAKYAAEKKITPRDCSKEGVAARGRDGGLDGGAGRMPARADRAFGQQHRGHLRPRDPRAARRVAARCRKAASSRCSARTAPARRRR